jgi:hypothetical protein
MASDTQLDRQPAKPLSAAERMRAYRHRRSQGLRCVEVQVGRAELHGLIAKGYLSPDKRNDLHEIHLAIEDFLFDCLKDVWDRSAVMR